MDNLLDKAEQLRKYEQYCYQIAYFLLEDESLAFQAASDALLELGLDESFFRACEQEQRNRVKRAAIQKSLERNLPATCGGR